VQKTNRWSSNMSADRALLLNVHAVERAIAPDDEITSAALAGSPEAFAKLHTLYSRRLYQTILAITKNPQDAEDALQDTFLRAYVAIGTFEGRCKVCTWLTRIAVNSALMVLRKRRVRPEMLVGRQPHDGDEIVLSEVKDSAPNPEQVYDLHQRQLILLRAIRGLHPHLRAPIRMQMMHGWSAGEIGRELNLSVAAVKARLHRARRRLSGAYDLSRSVRPSKGVVFRALRKRHGNPMHAFQAHHLNASRSLALTRDARIYADWEVPAEPAHA
jgi:RNA polymerase sigma-70 factor (ECF subfamily)